MHVVLFDIDGTLIRGEGMGSLAMKQALEAVYGVSAVAHEGLNGIPFNGRSDPAILQDMAGVLGIDAETFDRGFAAYKAAFLEKLEVTVAQSRTKRVLPGVSEILHRMDARDDVQLGLITGNFREGARIKLEPFQLNRYFPFGGFGDDGADRRDIAGAAYRRAQEHLGRDVPAERVLVIGDTVRDVDAAKAHGFGTVGVETGGVLGEHFDRAMADAWFPRLDRGFSEYLDAWLQNGRPA